MKNFLFVLLLGLATVIFTAMDMQMPAAPPNTTVETYDVSPTYGQYAYVVTVPEVAKARVIVQDAPAIAHSLNPNPVKSVEKTHRARYDLSSCLSNIVLFNQGRCVTSYDLRQKSTSAFSFLYSCQNTTPSIRRCILS